MADTFDSSSIHSFPIQLVNTPEALDRLDDDALIFQARLHATTLITGIQNGRIPATPTFIKHIRNLNAHLAEFDEPLDISFLDML
jgi:hypothetical protein